jgi:hypothetical protein
VLATFIADATMTALHNDSIRLAFEANAALLIV